ncbi:MAG TPA: response regulator [Gaiellaceae bacterium]|nr:response regulator [Gaiellaceae bacterium]
MVGERAVLVVDDDESIRLLCRVNLELAGHRVVDAVTLADASALLDEVEPDVVLLDVHVGAEDGLAFAAEIRARRPEAAVVLLTGSAELDALRAAGVDAVLRKPFDLDHLRRTVAQLAGRAHV